MPLFQSFPPRNPSGWLAAIEKCYKAITTSITTASATTFFDSKCPVNSISISSITTQMCSTPTTVCVFCFGFFFFLSSSYKNLSCLPFSVLCLRFSECLFLVFISLIVTSTSVLFCHLSSSWSTNVCSLGALIHHE